jgi:hypothetical protein
MYSLIERGGLKTLHAGDRRGAQELLAESGDWEDLLQHLETDLQIHLGEMAPERVFLHAGVVGWQGKALVLPGHSYSGKSTLVAALLRAGASYYSDEFAVLDRSGRVHPYPRPLTFRCSSAAGEARRQPASFGARTGSEPLTPGVFLLTRYRHGARWCPRLLRPGEAVLELMANCLPIRHRPEEALSVLEEAVNHALVVHSERSEAEEIVTDVLQILDGTLGSSPT